jgi:hypothetical protein
MSSSLPPLETISLQEFAGCGDEPNNAELALAEAYRPLVGFPRDTLGAGSAPRVFRNAAAERAAAQIIARAYDQIR